MASAVQTTPGYTLGFACTDAAQGCTNGMRKSLAVEFDTWMTTSQTDPAAVTNHCCLYIYIFMFPFRSVAHIDPLQGIDYWRSSTGKLVDSFRANHVAIFSSGENPNGNHHYLSVLSLSLCVVLLDSLFMDSCVLRSLPILGHLCSFLTLAMDMVFFYPALSLSLSCVCMCICFAHSLSHAYGTLDHSVKIQYSSSTARLDVFVDDFTVPALTTGIVFSCACLSLFVYVCVSACLFNQCSSYIVYGDIEKALRVCVCVCVL